MSRSPALCRRAFEGREASIGPTAGPTLDTAASLAHLLEEQGKLDEAETLMRRALAGFEEMFDPTHEHLINARGNLGALLTKRGGEEKEAGVVMVRAAIAALQSPPHSMPPSHEWIVRFTAALA